MDRSAVTQAVSRLVLDGIFPPMCIGCSAEGDWVCRMCLAAIPLVGKVELPSDGPLEGLLAVSAYQDPIVGGLIRSFKYQRALCLEDEALRSLLFRFGSEVDFLSFLGERPTMLVPLPMDPERERTRGLDHALRLAQLIQAVLFPDVPLVRAVSRTRLVQTNASLPTVEARTRNIDGVFRCAEGVEGESILLIDDVYTTGATLNEAATTLKGAKAAHVQACVLAQSGA